MKKLSPASKTRQIRRSFLEIRRRQRLSRKVFARKTYLTKPRKKVLTKLRKNVFIKAPKVFSLQKEDQRDELLQFIAKLDSAIDKTFLVSIDFSDTTRLMPCGTLLFVAHVETLIKKHTPKKVTCTYPANEVVEQLFQHIGFLEKLGLPPRKTITSDIVKYWFYLKGNRADMSVMKQLFKAYEDLISEVHRKLLYANASEAVTNVTNHAYPGALDNAEKGWWMFAEPKDNNLFIAVFDNGVGIPGSFALKEGLLEWFRKQLPWRRKNFDAWLIKEAVTSRRSSSKLPHRGNGLPDMLEFTTNSGGKLTVLSAKGAFEYAAERKAEKRVSFKTPLLGTLILWKIPLDERNPS